MNCRNRGAVVGQHLLAEVEAARQLAHDHQVDAVVAHRAQVGVRVELLAQLEQAGLGPARRRLPSRPANRSQEDRVGRPRQTAARTWAGVRGAVLLLDSGRRTAGAPGAGARPMSDDTASMTRPASAITSGPRPSPARQATMGMDGVRSSDFDQLRLGPA